MSVQDVFPWSVIYGHVNAEAKQLQEVVKKQEAKFKTLAEDCASEMLWYGVYSKVSSYRWSQLRQYLTAEDLHRLAGVQIEKGRDLCVKGVWSEMAFTNTVIEIEQRANVLVDALET